MSKDGKGGAGGPSIDLGFQMELAATLKAGFDGLQDSDRDRRERDRQHELEMIPLDHTIRGSGTAPSTGDLIFDCGGPPLGRAWVLRRLAVAGTDPTVAMAGAAYCFASSAGDSDQLITTTWFDVASSLPMVGWYTSRQVVIADGQRLWIKITSPTAGATYSASGKVMSEVANERAAARYTL
jgi:hypothetical protein